MGFAAAVAIALGAVLFWPTLVRGRTLLQAGDLLADPVWAAAPPGGRPGALPNIGDLSGALVDYPADLLSADALRHGRLPLWNPTVGLGTPLLAEWHTTPLSPFKLPFDLHPTRRMYDLYLGLRLLVAAAGVVLLARRRGLGRGAAALAAVAYAASGAIVCRFALPTEGTAHAVVPWLILALARAAEGDGRDGIAGGALATALLVLSAHPDLVALGLGGALVATGVGLAAPAAPGAWRSLRRGALAVALGLALGGVQIIPFLVHLAGGHSYKLAAGEADFFRGELAHLRATVGPLFYVGLAALALALLGAWDRQRGRGARIYIMITAALFGALVAAMRWLPAPWSGLVPARYAAFLPALGMAILAAEGATWLAARPQAAVLARRGAIALAAAAGALLCARHLAGGTLVDGHALALRALVVAAVVATACAAARCLARAWPTLGGALPALAAVAIAAELVAFARPRLYRTPEFTFEETPALRALRAAAPPPARVAGLGAGKLQEAALAPNVAGAVGLLDVRAVAAVFPRRYHELLAQVDGVKAFPTVRLLASAGSPLLGLLGVAVVAGPSSTPPPPGMRPIYRDASCALFRNPAALPRAFLAGGVLRAGSEGQDFDLLGARGREAAAGRLAIVEAPADALARAGIVQTGPQPPRADPAAAPIAADFVSMNAGEARVRASAPATRLLVISSLYDSSWHATLDGADAPLWPADGALSAVAVPPGTHEVVLRYRPASVRVGAIVSLLALVLAAALAARRRSGGRAASPAGVLTDSLTTTL